jgi:hypothetical protein
VLARRQSDVGRLSLLQARNFKTVDVDDKTAEDPSAVVGTLHEKAAHDCGTYFFR